MNSGDVFAAARAMGVKTVRLMIYQPKAGGAREWTCDIDTLERFAATARSKAVSVEVAAREYERMRGSPETEAQWADIFINPTPNDNDCAFCKAMAVCPNAAKRVLDSAGAPDTAATLEAFGAVADDEGKAIQARAQAAEGDLLAAQLRAVPFIEDWCTAVRAEAERRLLAGQPVAGFGLELGRQGPRQWSDPNAAVKVLREQFRLTVEQAFNLKVKSPTQIEALAPKVDKKTGKPKPLKEGDTPPVLGPRQWNKLQALITRSDPKPSVKPAAAIKVAYQPAAGDAFAAVPDAEDLG